MPADRVREAFEIQRGHCARMGSPFTASLLAGLLDVLDPETETGAAVLGWPGEPVADALALRLAGALHALARSGRDPKLTRAWSPAAEGDPLAAARAAIARHDRFVRDWIRTPPQTNETGRAGALLGGALILTAETGLPVELWEIGASAGLNLGFDGYAYDLGQGRSWGRADAPVRIPTEWRGDLPPLSAPLAVAARAACDVAPLDPADPATRERLAAFVWADQTARMARLLAALDDAASRPWLVDRSRAGDWLAARLAAPAPAGRLRLLWHSIVWQYIPDPEKAEIRSALEAAGARATAATPLAWLRMERDATPGSAGLALTLWPGGAERALARTDFHGGWTDWAPRGA